MTVNKTVTFKVGEKTVVISELAAELRERFATLDTFRQRQSDAMADLEMATMAVAVLTNQLQKAIQTKFTKPETGKNENE